MTAPPILWSPDGQRVERATITGYARWLEQTRGLDLPDYARLWEWSTTDIEAFWASIWERFGVISSQPYDRVLGSRKMPGAEWFPGARLNYAEHALRPNDRDAIAIWHASELRPLTTMTRGELRGEVAMIAGGLRSLGIGPGDRVAAYLPNIPEAVTALLACASIGAIWSSCSPDFGARSVIDRFEQIEPRVLLAVDGYRYGGNDFDRTPAVQELLAGLPTVEHAVVLGYLDPEHRAFQHPWIDHLGRAAGARSGTPLVFEQVPFDHPLWVLYSSGTTGPAEGDRARSRRDHPRDVEGVAPARRSAGRRPILLVHDDGLDDVELPRRRPHDRRFDRALRRQSRRAGSRRALGPGRGRSDHLLRDGGCVHRELPEGRAPTGRR